MFPFKFRRPSQSVGIFLSCISAIFSGTVLIHIILNVIAPQPYMDEIFHVDQMQRYCQGRLTEWNPKLTTPPGLYLFILALLKPVMIFIRKNSESACTVSVLRYFNAFFVTLLFCVHFALFRTLNSNKRTSSVIISISALNLTLFPVCYFFSFLFYTDVLSILSVLFAYLLQQHRFLLSSAFVGAFSCLMRQTNIIWVIFCAACTAADIGVQYAVYYEKNYKNDSKSMKNRTNSYRTHADASTTSASIVPDFYDDPLSLLNSLYRMIKEKPNLFVNFVVNVIVRCSGFICVGFVFLACVFWNGGFALGDKSAHQACPHIVQAFYFAGFTVFFASPLILPYLTRVLYQIKSHGFLSRILFVAVLVSIYGFTYDHPYLLADNRHYSFYVWRKFFQLHVGTKYLLAPIYVFAIYALIMLLNEQPAVWRFLFVAATVVVTVPNRLLEFRYFIAPYCLWRLHVPLQSKWTLSLEFLLYALINVVTLYLFLFKPFVWSNEPGLQRFMW